MMMTPSRKQPSKLNHQPSQLQAHSSQKAPAKGSVAAPPQQQQQNQQSPKPLKTKPVDASKKGMTPVKVRKAKASAALATNNVRPANIDIHVQQLERSVGKQSNCSKGVITDLNKSNEPSILEN